MIHSIQEVGEMQADWKWGKYRQTGSGRKYEQIGSGGNAGI